MWEKTLVPVSSSWGSNLLTCNPVVVLGPGMLKDPQKGRGASHHTASPQAAWLYPVCQALLVAEEQSFSLTKWKFLVMKM